MALRIYNTLTKQKEEFVPRQAGEVAMYVCGITPYDYSHMGHARSYVAFDVIRRYLKYSGYQVRMVENITDIDDKIIARANESEIDYRELARKFTNSFFQDMDALGVERADLYPTATEHIPDMIELIEGLIERGFAYQIDGDVYFEVRKFPGYGKLSKRDLDDLRAGARVEVDERKRDPLDFALWKSAKPGEPSWESPWGPGRPGWHIECSAMSLKHLGNGFDLHGGGADLIFPHHENEIAQSEAYTGEAPFVRYWLHTGWLTINHQKMSKSLGNFFAVKEVLARYSPETVRYFLMTTHYRSQLEFSDAALEEAEAALERLRIAIQNLDRLVALPTAEAEDEHPASFFDESARNAEQAFRQAMEDDFNTPRALGAIFCLVGEVNQAINSPQFRLTAGTKNALQRVKDCLSQLTGVLGILGETPAKAEGLTERLIDLLVSVRVMAREKKQYEIADAIREKLAEMGVVLEDHREGTSWRLC